MSIIAIGVIMFIIGSEVASRNRNSDIRLLMGYIMMILGFCLMIYEKFQYSSCKPNQLI